MLILAHITVALTSILLASHTYFKPSATKLHVSYGLTAATLISGTYLVISTHSRLVSSCMAGTFYLGFVLAALAGARRRLAADSD